ncbi:type VI secretion system-associated FHA domain protein TagH [Methylocapsa palsarum]|uniref:Type VI secretion system protein ImpI n=1 Tax=Methylocapsa palsarum TaxID=1612308 RepID=A0A1I3YPQ6_9HYPH|nr:type VI secretion system-associated FHA domain protein TagH [Methylocapsa palsarum]SFK33339.1 type VI secretion system protein ImpI [Methylocapsa palsarum]
MTLILTIENEQSLPNGAPVSVRLDDKRSFDIGRAAHLGWTLPDPTRFISGRHCELKYRDGAYWLNDLSTNGTFLNGGTRRMQAPHRLRDGDRLSVGPFVIAVSIEEEAGDASQSASTGLDSESALTPESRLASESRLAAIASQEPALGFEAGELALNDAAPRGESAGEGRNEAQAGGELSTLPFSAQALEIEAWGATDRSQGREREAVKGDGGRADGGAEAPSAEAFLRSFAKGAGISEQIFARQDPLRVAEDLGALMRLSVENLTQLLSARFKAKRFARTSSQTMIQALDNNPLKFAPTPDDALKIMFGPRTSGYLEARRAFEGAFKDLKTHQVNTFAAMQQAVRMLVEDLDPETLEEAVGPEGGFSGLLGSRKRRLWDLYLARWNAKTLRHQDGLVDAFMLYFAECYDEAKNPEARS